MERTRYRVVITDCDHGSVEEEKEEFGGAGAQLFLAKKCCRCFEGKEATLFGQPGGDGQDLRIDLFRLNVR